ncbi:MlaE family ABC transporter permease [Sciscionella sediminilitoris]|uniref:MlaE family ABC transporter permease n=1 Tax=Sciscionella sediminilitoris TaxID=1445613 RepID=UPI0004DF208F|nr:ABC transporter permease [Sciscionella sp. SE31]
MALPMRRVVVLQGRRFVDALAELGDQFVFYLRSLGAVPKAIRSYWQQVVVLIGQISFGTASMIAAGGTVGVVFGMAFITSAQLGLEGQRGLGLIGLTPLTGLLGSVINTRELAPLVASIALAAKVGTGFTAQLGAMRISEEVDALESMAVRSLPFLVTTRMLAALISVLPLYLLGLFASYLATYLSIVVLGGQSSGTYDYFFQLMLTPEDVVISVAKALIFAVIVTLVHCYYGYTAHGGPEGVGRAAGRALRTSLVTLVILDMILAFAFYGIPPKLPGIGVGS